MTSASSEFANPQRRVAIEKPICDPIITFRQPNCPVSQPDIGVTTAVARILNVMTQEIWSGVADKLPCICGKTTLTIRMVMA